MERIDIKGKEYTFVTDYRKDDCLRKGFNELTQAVYKFDFENWYRNGFWDDSCIPYSLLDGDKMVANVTVNKINFSLQGATKQFVQLGTVMTHPDHRNCGLSRFLMDRVLTEFRNNCDMIYLFANDTVLDFYPKFGFVSVDEYQAVREVTGSRHVGEVKKLDLDVQSDLVLFEQFVRSAAPVSQLSMLDNLGLIMFYCKYFSLFCLEQSIYYLPDEEAVVIAVHEGEVLIIYDIFASRKTDLDRIIDLVANGDTQKVILKFMPDEVDGFDFVIAKEDDLTLFVENNKAGLFEENKLMFPILSHT